MKPFPVVGGYDIVIPKSNWVFPIHGLIPQHQCSQSLGMLDP